ncbi:hypothetical protein AB6A40_007873 [Gnathostoma spinigerum]|uniref:Uncharacterized protein n=1 Tax=Gnathostoma spinigerum TaxID=75299 RepID=A0ABD6EMH5_9BILA
MLLTQTIVFVVCQMINAQPVPLLSSAQVSSLTENAQRFIDLYGLATQIMNLGGSVINTASGKNGGMFGSSGNGILGDFLPGLNNIELNENGRNSLGKLSEYGGGELGVRGNNENRSARQTGLETLLNTFLGPASPPSNPTYKKSGFVSTENDYEGKRSTGVSDIDSLINALVRNGAKQAVPENSEGAQSLLKQFFGKR